MPPKFSKVDEHLYRGGEPDLDELPILKDVWGIDQVISLDGPIGKNIDKVCKKLGLKHIILPLTDGDGDNVDKLPELSKMIEENGKTYIHCKHGKDRTSLACATYRIFSHGWDLEKAAIEAYKFGMGMGLSPKVKKSYYTALKKIFNDKNSIDDIVTLQRDSLTTKQPETSYEAQNLSWAPYLDVEVDHLNRPASKNESIVKEASTKIYKYCKMSGILSWNTLWYDSPESAKKFADGDLNNAKLFSAYIPKNANIKEFPHEPTKSLVHAAMLSESDVAIFKSENAPIQYFVINPSALESISKIDLNEDDVNNALLVGEHDNYTGLAPHFSPGSGGLGGAGMVELPYTQEL